MFLKVDGKTPEMVASSEGLLLTTIVNRKNDLILIMTPEKQDKTLDWPP